LRLQQQGESNPRPPPPSIARLGTSRTAFVGRTLRGPVNRPVILASFAEYQTVFGGLWQPSSVGYAVEQYFDNGGREAIVVRVANGARASTLTLTAGGGCLRLRAVRPGSREFLRASVDYDNIAAADASEFNLTVQRVRVQGTSQVEDQEIFAKASLTSGTSRFVGELLARSELVRLDGTVPACRPDRTMDASSGLATRYVSSNADGDDGAPLCDYDVIGSDVDKTGLFALDTGVYFNLLCIPPLSRTQDLGASTLLVAARFCKARRALMIVDPPAGWHTADDALHGMRAWDLASDSAVMYFPRILAHDKLRGHFEAFAPCGAVAGMLARADEASPAWGPAAIDDAILRPGFRPSCLVAEDRRRRLAAVGVNTIQAVRSAARMGVAPRTLAVASDLLARRMVSFILNSVVAGTRWTVLDATPPNVLELVSAQLGAFFERLYHAGSFGKRPIEDAFFVVCDRRMNPPERVAHRHLQFLIGFAAARQREFHGFRIEHSPAGSTVEPLLDCGRSRQSTFDLALE